MKFCVIAVYDPTESLDYLTCKNISYKTGYNALNEWKRKRRSNYNWRKQERERGGGEEEEEIMKLVTLETHWLSDLWSIFREV